MCSSFRSVSSSSLCLGHLPHVYSVTFHLRPTYDHLSWSWGITGLRWDSSCSGSLVWPHQVGTGTDSISKTSSLISLVVTGIWCLAWGCLPENLHVAPLCGWSFLTAWGWVPYKSWGSYIDFMTWPWRSHRLLSVTLMALPTFKRRGIDFIFWWKEWYCDVVERACAEGYLVAILDTILPVCPLPISPLSRVQNILHPFSPDHQISHHYSINSKAGAHQLSVTV